MQEQEAGAHVILAFLIYPISAKFWASIANGMITGLVASQKYCTANPKTCQALTAALTEAHAWINEDKDRVLGLALPIVCATFL